VWTAVASHVALRSRRCPRAFPLRRGPARSLGEVLTAPSFSTAPVLRIRFKWASPACVGEQSSFFPHPNRLYFSEGPCFSSLMGCCEDLILPFLSESGTLPSRTRRPSAVAQSPCFLSFLTGCAQCPLYSALAPESRGGSASLSFFSWK